MTLRPHKIVSQELSSVRLLTPYLGLACHVVPICAGAALLSIGGSRPGWRVYGASILGIMERFGWPCPRPAAAVRIGAGAGGGSGACVCTADVGQSFSAAASKGTPRRNTLGGKPNQCGCVPFLRPGCVVLKRPSSREPLSFSKPVANRLLEPLGRINSSMLCLFH